MSLNRRTFLKSTGVVVATGLTSPLPAFIRGAGRPRFVGGLQSGDISPHEATIWAAAEGPARMIVEVSGSESFRKVRRLEGPNLLVDSGFTGKLRVRDLPAGSDVHLRVTLEDLDDPIVESAPLIGRFRTAPDRPQDIRFLFSGDTAGQGWGIDQARGGMRIYETMRQRNPDFFIHCGDQIYADNPLPDSIELADGSSWNNLVTPEKAKVAETLDEFRGNYRYNLLDPSVRRFQSEVAQLVQWDDHETVNNWYPGEVLEDDRYQVKSVDLLAARAKRAFHEWTPIDSHPDTPDRIHRSLSFGPLLEVFLLDLRSFRTPNASAAKGGGRVLGAAQLEWLSRSLRASRATWKVIASDMPLGLILPDHPAGFEGIANGEGPPRGREQEIAELLRTLKREKVRNVVWVTADVHYAAAHHYRPERAQFTEFDSFWEFVGGPLHAGTFGPNQLDPTFGPEVVFQKAAGETPNLPPSAGLQFFGEVSISAVDRTLRVTLIDIDGKPVFEKALQPTET